MLLRSQGGHSTYAKLTKEKRNFNGNRQNILHSIFSFLFYALWKTCKIFQKWSNVCINKKTPLQVKIWEETSEDYLAAKWKYMKVSIILLM